MFGHGMENVLKANPTWTTVGTIAFSGVTGGVVAELTGGDFWKGAAIGVTIAALNHTMHQLLDDGGDPGKRNVKQDGKLSDGEIKQLQKKQGWSHREKGRGGGKYDYYKDKKTGEIYQKPKGGVGEGEPTGYNVEELWKPAVGGAIGAAILKYGEGLLQLLGRRLSMPILIIPQLVPNNDPYGANTQTIY